MRRTLLFAALALVTSLLTVLRAELTPTEAKIAAAVDAQGDEFAHDLEAAVRISSATEDIAGIKRLAEFYRERFAPLGFEVRYADVPASTKRAGHFIAERKGKRGKRVLLLGHMDTVYPASEVRRDGDILHGAGVADMKGGNGIILQALRALHSAGQLDDTQIIVLFSGDEEAPGPLEISRKEMRAAGARSDVVLAFEGVIGSTATIARRGSYSWELEVQGATGHSSGIFSAAMGSGSVYEAARILTEFHAAIRKFDGLTANPAMIVGGAEVELDRTGGTTKGKTNIVAQRTLVRGDLRPVSAEQLAQAQAVMQEIVARSSPRTSATLKFNEGYPAMSPSDGSYALLAQFDQVSRDLGLGEITAFDPRGRGAGDIAFVSPPLPGLDGLGLGGNGEHSPKESGDLSPAPVLIKRAAIMIHRLTR